MFAPTLSTLLAEWDTAKTAARTSHLLSPSDLGSGCDRKTAYRIRNTEPDTVGDTRKAVAGSLIHAGLDPAIRAAGGMPEVSVRLDLLNPLLGIGHADIWWPADGTVDDVKTKGERAYESWTTHGPDEGELRQARAYAWGIAHGYGRDEDGGTLPVDAVDTVRILAYNRETGASETFVEAYDDEAARAAVDMMVALAEDIRAGVDIPRQGNGPGLGFPCDWCEFAATCWNLGAVPPGRSPQSAGVEVADPEWIAAADEYLTASEQEKKAKDAKAAARARLVGVPGVAGTLKVAWTGGNPKPDAVVPDPDAMEVLLQEAGLEVPTMTKPGGTTPVAIRVTRVRPQL